MSDIIISLWYQTVQCIAMLEIFVFVFGLNVFNHFTNSSASLATCSLVKLAFKRAFFYWRTFSRFATAKATEVQSRTLTVWHSLRLIGVNKTIKNQWNLTRTKWVCEKTIVNLLLSFNEILSPTKWPECKSNCILKTLHCELFNPFDCF
jgi:hypothetical protein